jgi:predicted ester cyclase
LKDRKLATEQDNLKANKAAVQRFNTEVIERGNERAFGELLAPHFVNRTAPAGLASGPEGMLQMFNRVLRPAFPDLRVEIHQQVAEGDKVTTHKTIHGTHRGEFFGVPATNRRVAIQVMDIVRLENGRYVEHWGVNTLFAVLASLREPE